VIRRRFPSIHVIAMSGAFDGDEVPTGVAADAYYQKSGRKIGTLVEVIESILTVKGSPEICDEEDVSESAQPEPTPQVAIWVTRRGTPIDAPHILLSCPECMRSFPHCADGSDTMQVKQIPCVFCGAPIRYALLDSNITHHPGYAPR
jgi:hypothetical protein